MCQLEQRRGKEYFEQLKSEMRVPSKHSHRRLHSKIENRRNSFKILYIRTMLKLSTRCEFHAEPADLVVTTTQCSSTCC